MWSPAEIIWLHDGVGQPWLDAAAVAEHLAAWLPWLRCERRGDLLGESAVDPAALVERLARARVTTPTKRAGGPERRLLRPELDFESRVLTGQVRASAGVVYDGCELQWLAAGLLRGGAEAIHLWLTERLFATWDDDDRRYHLRVILCGVPTMVSTTGMVRAPARERSYYLSRSLGVRPEEAATADFLDHEDPRTADVVKGYAMQAVFYALTGEPFCDDSACRLFNAHWQSEMLAAQLQGDDYCRRHRDALDAWAAEQGACIRMA